MECKKVSATVEQLLDPTSAAWNGVPAETLEMAGTPLANQPSEYIKASRDERQALRVRPQHAREGAPDALDPCGINACLVEAPVA